MALCDHTMIIYVDTHFTFRVEPDENYGEASLAWGRVTRPRTSPQFTEHLDFLGSLPLSPAQAEQTDV